MIEKTFKSKRPITVYQPTNQPHNVGFTQEEFTQSRIRGITPLEYRRRNGIVSRLSRECDYKPGDIVYPVKQKDYELYGACRVVHIVHSYHQMGQDEKWPASDYPFIVAFTAVNTDLSKEYGIIHCTINYLSPNNNFIPLTC